MRIVFLGASKFGIRCLRAALAATGCDVVGVVTAPKTFSISYRPQGVTNVLHEDAHGLCEAAGIPCLELGAAGMRDEALLAAVRAWRPDAFLVAGWYHIVPAGSATNLYVKLSPGLIASCVMPGTPSLFQVPFCSRPCQ